MERKRQQQEEQQLRQQIHQQNDILDDDVTDNSGDEETDDEDDDDDYGPAPAAGVWAGSKRLITESEVIGDNEDGPPGPKKAKTES
jgi:hypothetical protein